MNAIGIVVLFLLTNSTNFLLSPRTSYLQDKLPYSNRLLKSLSCLHLDQKDSSSKKIATVAAELPCSKGEIGLVIDEWKIYQELEIPRDLKFLETGKSPKRVSMFKLMFTGQRCLKLESFWPAQIQSTSQSNKK